MKVKIKLKKSIKLYDVRPREEVARANVFKSGSKWRVIHEAYIYANSDNSSGYIEEHLKWLQPGREILLYIDKELHTVRIHEDKSKIERI